MKEDTDKFLALLEQYRRELFSMHFEIQYFQLCHKHNVLEQLANLSAAIKVTKSLMKTLEEDLQESIKEKPLLKIVKEIAK